MTDVVKGRTELLSTFALIYIVAAGVKIAIDYAAQHVEANAIESIILSLRADLYAHVLSLSPGSLGKSTSRDVLTRLEGDTIRTETFIYTAPLVVVADGAAAVGYICLLFYLNWQLTLCTLAALPLIAWIVNRISPLVRRSSRLARRGEALWMSLAAERLDAVASISAFDSVARERRAFELRADKVRRMEVLLLILLARQSALVEIVVAIGGLTVLGIGAILIGSGALTLGALVVFIGTVNSLQTPVRSLAKSA